uniref:Uncharacterized protein n=1 Tax=Phytophthora ramorum TaxID=164328 RepID=H3GGA2_PHYRM
MARTSSEPPFRTSSDVLSWLRRWRREELPVARVLDCVRSASGVVPLGGRVGGSDGATPPATPKNSALTLFSAGNDAQSGVQSAPEQDDKTRWTLLTSSCQLPASCGAQELRKALETLQPQEKDDDKLDLEAIRGKFFQQRRNFFAVRIELLRVARNPEHPNAQAAAEAVDELLKEGLRDALLDEVHGRQFCQPPRLAGVGTAERKALVAWELQFLEEEALLRELLLLTLVASRERATLDCAVKMAKTVHTWETRVFDEVLSSSTLALPAAQEAARKLTQVGVLVALRLLYTAGAVQDHRALQQATTSFFLTELCGVSEATGDVDVGPSPVPGVLLLAWAALLGRQYRQVAEASQTEEAKEMETILQHTLAAAEKLHSFHFLNALLRSLVFNNHADTDNVESEPFLQPLSLHAKTLWALPNVASSAGLRGVNTAQLQYQSNSDSAPIFQHVVAAFLDDMLSSLGYMDNLEGAQQLHAMVKFVLPALSSTIVARQILGIEAEDSSMTDVAVLKYFNKPRAGLEEHMIRRTGIVRQLPPEEYFSVTAGEIERVQCTRSFAYEDGEDRLAVPAGTIGTVWRSTDGVQVEWLLADTEGKNEPSLWDLLTLSADSFVAGLQSGSFADLHRTDAEDASVLAAFFEFIVQLGQQHDGGQFDLGELERRWGEARLRRWWMDRRLPSPEVHVNQLVRQQIALPMLLSASRENLVSWGIRDRYTRELILVQLGSGDSIAYANTVTDGSIDSFGVDGGTHLLRLLLGVLDGFVHAGANDNAMMDGESAWSTARLHLVAASFLALSTLLATTTGVDLLMRSSVGGGQEECVNLIVKSAKKLFELQERLVGEYPVVLATHEIFLSVVRWFLSKEAQTLADSFGEGSVGSQAFIAMERLWFVGATEFAIEVLSTHESWKFTSTSERCEVKERCFRLLFVLVLPRKYVSERNDMIPAFEKALRETLSTDMSLLMKLLRSSCAVLSPMEGHVGHWNSIATTDNDANDASSSGEEDSNGHFPLVYETEFDSGGVNLVQLEALVTTCLRLLELLVANRTSSVDAQTVRKLLLTPIDDGGPKKRKSLTIVTLCGGYLDYSVEKAPGIAYWSLLILQHAAVVLDYRQERESRGLSSMHSLVALFHGNQDLPLVRGMFARLLRVSSPHHLALRKEVIEMLTLCLEHQPGFLALLLLGDDRKENSTSDERSEGPPLPFVALLEHFFGASEQLLEQSSDLFCALLTFLVQVWKGAIHNGLAVHLKIMAALRERSTFWPNVTRALKIHMPLESVEERGLLDIELAAVTVQGRGGVGSSSESYTGRSNYSPAQLEQYASSIRRACSLNTPTANLLGDIPVGNISLYLEGLICDASALKWQLSAGGDIKLQASPADVRALKLVQWSNLQAAFLHAQLFSLTKWKVFMELCCLQAGGGSESPLEKAAEPTTPRRLKRKESMISSPPRSSVMNSTASSGSTSRLRVTMSASSASSSESALSSSRFSGDRTSFGMIQVLADVIRARVEQHENQDEVLDYFVLLHLQDLVQLLVSMLHHQLCLVVRKTRDPKLSQTRQRLDGSSASDLKLDAAATLQLLGVIEKTASAVHDSMGRIAREVELVRLGSNDSAKSSSSVDFTAVPLIARLVTGFEQKVEVVTDGLHTSLFTAALLLVRHLSKISHQSRIGERDFEMDGIMPPRPLLQVKLIAHCMNAITLCDSRSQPTTSTQSLFQLSWCLFQEVLDSFSSVDAPLTSKPKLCMANAVQLNPFVKELEHDRQGIGALFHLLVQRFRPSSYSKEVATRQEEACQVLRGLAAVVWNPENAELCQRVMLNNGSSRSSSRLRLLSMLATQLLPLLQAQMEREEATSSLRGYVVSASDEMETEDKGLDRSLAHRMWCLVLDFVGGLLRLQVEATGANFDDADVWDFMSHAEALLLAAVEPTTCQRLTRAVISEHQALLRLLSALSGNASRRKRWRQAFPSNSVVLMEQSRQLLRRACVLLGSSSAEISRLRKEKSQKQKATKSPSSKSLAVRDVEKRKLTDFHREMETQLVEIVRLASLLLTKWTGSLTDRDAILVVDGVRYVDEEQLMPLLAFIPASEARTMNSSPGLGHLTLAMDFMLDQLVASEDESQARKPMAVLASAIDVCALLFLKTYLLHAEQYELVKRDRDELSKFFRQFSGRLSGDDSGASVAVDAQLIQHIGKIIAG